jgi:hypothetical protein
MKIWKFAIVALFVALFVTWYVFRLVRISTRRAICRSPRAGRIPVYSWRFVRVGSGLRNAP